MLVKDNPYLSSTETTIGEDVEQSNLIREVNQIHFAIIDHKDKYYSLNETSRYINISVIHTNFTYNNTKETKNLTYSSLADCSMEDFN